jgi:hypothetical protein
MILCCDTINLVKKAAKDIKIKRSLSRKRSETSRSASVGRYTVLDHSKDDKKNYFYERDTVNKVAKVSELKENFQTRPETIRAVH